MAAPVGTRHNKRGFGRKCHERDRAAAPEAGLFVVGSGLAEYRARIECKAEELDGEDDDEEDEAEDIENGAENVERGELVGELMELEREDALSL